MAYVSPNFKSKKALKDACKDGKDISVFSTSPFSSGKDYSNGTFTVEGPHYPAPHKWAAQVTVENGKVVKVT